MRNVEDILAPEVKCSCYHVSHFEILAQCRIAASTRFMQHQHINTSPQDLDDTPTPPPRMRQTPTPPTQQTPHEYDYLLVPPKHNHVRLTHQHYWPESTGLDPDVTNHFHNTPTYVLRTHRPQSSLSTTRHQHPFVSFHFQHLLAHFITPRSHEGGKGWRVERRQAGGKAIFCRKEKT